ncbi:hypothetical protein [Roseiconus lacunae]|uniref:hypothetical protein n=1 Tax=Roseiconus lacunae TaxID=2605694 RepID=UPI001E4534FB|nr:hypothetical protein [Roseiconus lacunae]MCD0463552.1 hypothetical protein [Roseiconus lacunae]
MTVEPDALPSLVDESLPIHAAIDACDDTTTDDGLVSDVNDDSLAIIDDNDRLWEENEALRRQLQGVFEEIDQLKRQNATLSSQLQEAKQSSKSAETASASGQTRTNATGSNASSWNERKQQIIEQLENGSFDAEAFLSSLRGGPAKSAIDIKPPGDDAVASPTAALDQATSMVEQLYGELVQLREAEEIYQDQLHLLREELETLHLGAERSGGPTHQSTGDQQGTGDKQADAILANDEIIAQERERLTLLQEEVEEKLRTIEIRSSLERAQFSRRSNELQKLNDNLQRQVEDLKQRLDLEVGSGASTRWMQKLGLGAKNDQ